MSENESIGRRKAKSVLKRFLRALISDFRAGFRDLRARIQKEVAATKPVEAPSLEAESPSSPDLRPVRMLKRRNAASEGSSGGASGGAPWGRVLVVGGMDFLGAGIVRQLNRQGLRDIVIVDDLGDGRWRNLSALRMERFLKPAEMAEGHGRRLLGQRAFSHLFYLGGWGGSAPVPSAHAILEMALQQESRLISLSPAEALGVNPDPDDVRQGRVENFCPETEAGVLANLFDRVATEKLGNRFVAAKYHQLFGPGKPAGTFNDWLLGAREQILAEGAVRLPQSLQPGTESGDRKFDFMSLRRAVQMTLFLGGRSSAAGIFELGTGVGHTVVDLLEALFKTQGRKPAFVWDQPGGPSALRVGICPDHADLSRLRAEGWTCGSPALELSLRTYLDSLSAGDDAYWREMLDQDLALSGPGQGPVGRTPKNFRKKPFVPHAGSGKRRE